MKQTSLQKRNISSSRLALGCMGFGGGWNKDPITRDHVVQAEKAIDTALSIGITMFDHADIYTMGKAEEVFGEILKEKPSLREDIILQSKCGIRFPEGNVPVRYDFSRDYILSSVDGILKRLNTEYIDILLLHRPDPLMEPEQVSEAFNTLKQSGKVKHFGVSNMNSSQMKYLQSYLSDPLVVNQLEMNLSHLDWLDHGVHVNQQAGSTGYFSDGILEYCQMEDVQLQAWGPLARGKFTGRSVINENDSVAKTVELVKKMAKEKGTSTEAIVLGWLMKHPAKIQPVIGTTNPTRIQASQDAIHQSETMTRDEWYSLYVSSRGVKLP
ncbi:aldo/keto reductase [Litchfieldia salsa]|uniref:Predicted oxidoreductase n=1 Tax=Litchfieldia salsa TaxID=930152 RepID=A0A1H0TB33_9BACI|nr:aldo/keto reductase [Litchfieldia salsa]SDP51273.1 Predicted oxidoreductase [Litchfieldia salsa]